MQPNDHEDGYSPAWRGFMLGILVVCSFWLLSVAGDCGDVRGDDALVVDSDGDGQAGRDGPGSSGGVDSVPVRVDPEAFALAARMQAWQPTWRERHPGELADVATAIVAACRVTPWPSAERCPDMIGALIFKESSWRVTAVGRRGEIGLMQLLPGVATAGETRATAADPEVNVRLGLTHLRRCAALCRLAGHDSTERALSLYAGLRCVPSRGSALVLRWERELRGAGR